MKVNSYLYFNGNCADAIAFYEKAFNVKAEVMPNEETKNLVAHAQIEIGGYPIFLCDAENPVKVGDNVAVTIRIDEDELPVAKVAFDTLKDGGEIIMELEENSWNNCFGLLVDKFGIKWMVCQGLK